MANFIPLMTVIPQGASAPRAGTAADVGAIQAQVAAQQAQDAAQLARDQAQVIRNQAQAIRDRSQALRDAARARAEAGTLVVPGPAHSLSRHQEGMLFAGFMTLVMAGVIVLYPIFRALGKRIERVRTPDPLGSSGSAQRLERIEQAVEAMAIEIERISEGQRFTTRLLSDRTRTELPAESLGRPL